MTGLVGTDGRDTNHGLPSRLWAVVRSVCGFSVQDVPKLCNYAEAYRKKQTKSGQSVQTMTATIHASIPGLLWQRNRSNVQGAFGRHDLAAEPRKRLSHVIARGIQVSAAKALRKGGVHRKYHVRPMLELKS